jgi:hypothetical protein
MSRVADAVEDQAELHVELAKAEFARDAGSIGKKSAPVILGLLLFGIGYALLCVAVTLALSTLVGPPLAVGLVGVVNLLVGGGLAAGGVSFWNRSSASGASHETPARPAGVLDVR